MSDSGEANGRLSDLEEIAEALRAGDLDPVTRFGRRRNDQTETAQGGKTPDEILEELQSDGRDCGDEKIVTSTGVEIDRKVATEWSSGVTWDVGETVAEVKQSFGVDPRMSASAMAYELLDQHRPSPDDPLVILVKIEEGNEDHLFVLYPQQNECGDHEFVLVEVGEARQLGAMGLQKDRLQGGFVGQ